MLARSFDECERGLKAAGWSGAVFASDRAGVITHWGSGAQELFGWASEEAVGRPGLTLLAREVDLELTMANFERVRSGEILAGERLLQRRDGTPVAVWSHRAPVLLADRMVGAIGICARLQDREGITQELVESQALRASILRAALDAIVVIDADGSVVEFNPAAERMFGHSREQALGRELAELVVPERHRHAHREGLARAAATGQGRILDSRLEIDALRADGSEFPVELTVTRMRGSPLRFAGFIRDVSERVESELRVADLGEHDQLTGLLNRSSLRRELSGGLTAADAAAHALALLQIDLRRFSLVNDSLGRQEGDTLLRALGERLTALEPTPIAVAREGGDEFWLALALEEVSIHTPDWRSHATRMATERAATVHAVLADPFAAAGTEISLRGSIGISIYPLDALNRETMFEHAEVATRDAQRSAGRPAVVFSGRSGDPREELALSNRLSRALPRGQFELHYQPVVDLGKVAGAEDGAVHGVEALLRWRDPTETALVQPAGFLPLLEETGLITGVGHFVVEELFRQLAEWRREGHPLHGAFNLSALELWQPDLAEQIAGEAARNELPPECLSVEITETAVVEDLARAREVLDELRSLGFQLAIDDFGVGHSSLGRLRELSVDVLKIDRTFTSKVPGDPASETIVAAILQAAEGLDLVTVAEGIETEEQRDFMLERGCLMGQGFLFGRPTPASEVAFV